MESLEKLIGRTGIGRFWKSPFPLKGSLSKIMKNEQDKFEVRHYKKYRSEDAKAGKRHRMCATFALSGIKRHARTPCSDALPYSWSAGERTEFQYPDLSWKESCGMMANLVADSGCNKGQLGNLVEAICQTSENTMKRNWRNSWSGKNR